jgi:hypothetical protein
MHYAGIVPEHTSEYTLDEHTKRLARLELILGEECDSLYDWYDDELEFVASFYEDMLLTVATNNKPAGDTARTSEHLAHLIDVLECGPLCGKDIEATRQVLHAVQQTLLAAASRKVNPTEINNLCCALDISLTIAYR